MEENFDIASFEVYTGTTERRFDSTKLRVDISDGFLYFELCDPATESEFNVWLNELQEVMAYGCRLILLAANESYNIRFGSADQLKRCSMLLKSLSEHNDHYHQGSQVFGSLFDKRTSSHSANAYFNFYSQLIQQQNMLQDQVRMYTYFNSIIQNPSHYKDKVVLDVGAGTGILSFFAAQAGAKKVYAVEASNMSHFAKKLVKDNVNYSNVIEVIHGKIEEIELPEKVDTIISEPIGYFLVNERMLESFLHAKKFLNPNGRVFPSESLFYYAPFTDDLPYNHIAQKLTFWCNHSFFGVDLTVLEQDALKEVFSQPIIDMVDCSTLQSHPGVWRFNFETLTEFDLRRIEIPFKLQCVLAGPCHGFAFWFDVGFCGDNSTFWLPTGPHMPPTHWYQVRCLFPTPLTLQSGDTLSGTILMVCNQRQSYDVTIDAFVEERPHIVTKATIDLKTPYFLAGVPLSRPTLYRQPPLMDANKTCSN